MSALTFQIDDDLRRQLEACASRQNTSVDGVINAALRAGLPAVEVPEQREPFVQRTHNMGQPLIDITHLNAVLDDLDTQEASRKMGLGR